MADERHKKGLSSERNKQDDENNRYVLQILGYQGQLYAYILSLVVNRDCARDILQQTNVVLLEKESEFEHGTNFGAWACRIALYEVLAYRRGKSRDRHLFSDQLLALIAEDAETVVTETEDRLQALRLCLGKLDRSKRKLLEARYSTGGTVSAIAEVLKKTPGAISAELHRIRNGLADCISQRLRGAA